MKQLLFYLILVILPIGLLGQSPAITSTSIAEKNSASHVNSRRYPPQVPRLTRSKSPIQPPLGLSSFVAQAHHVSVLLSWGVVRPAKQASFIVERALGNAGWEKVGVVPSAQGQQSFSFWDVRVEPGASYQYRLVRAASNGDVQVSQPIRLAVDGPFDEYLIIFGLLAFISYLAYHARKLA